MATRTTKRKYEHVTVVLTPEDRAALDVLTRRGQTSARVLRRARILMLLDQGWSTAETRDAVGVSHTTVLHTARRYVAGGRATALHDDPRPGGPRALTTEQASKVAALACTPPPDGFARWTVRLLTAHAIARELVPPVGHETIRQVLATHDLKPWREKNVVRARPDADVRDADGGRARHLRAAARSTRAGAGPG